MPMSTTPIRAGVLARRVLPITLAVAAAFAPACLDTRPWRSREPPWSEASFSESDEVRVQRSDGSWMFLSQAHIGRDARGVVLHGTSLTTGAAPPRALEVPLSDVVRLDVRHTEPARVLGNALIGTLLAVLVLSTVFVAWLVTIEVMAAG